MIDIKVEKLKQKMVHRDVSEKALARKLWITRRTLMKILDGQGEFTGWQIKKIAEVLSLNNDEIMFIFFDKKVS